MKQRLWLWLSLILAVVGCSTAPSGDEFALQTIDTSAEKQASYSNQWVANVANRTFSGDPDIWGYGNYYLEFAFDSAGNLHDQDPSFPQWYPLHRIVAFKSETEAIVTFYSSASSFTKELYALEIRDDGLYRTMNFIGTENRGFTTMSAWDGATYSTTYLEKIATNDTSFSAPTLTVPNKD